MKRLPSPWDWQGAVALILTVSVGISIVALAIGATYNTRTGAQDAQLLSTVLGASVGAIAGWLGFRSVWRRYHDNDDEEEEETQP